nr:MAG TPA_asm: hypothetical protein [Caudoviricetes sp.]
MYDDTGANWLSTSRVALFPKPTFYRLPCGSHADNFT